MTEHDRQHWATVTEAAAILGVSERTVWRRVKAGKLDIDRSVTPHVVDVAAYIDTDTDNGNDVSDTVSEGLVQRLRAENERLRAELEHRDEIIARLDQENNRLWQAHATALRALPEPAEDRDSDEPQERGWLARLWPWGK
jgi:hypothetical protein